MITPVRPIDTSVPWGWNPAATFLTAYNAQQESQREREKMAMEQELYRILLPQKAAEAEFNLKKLAYDTELLTDAYKTRTAELEERRRIIKTGGTGSGSNAAGSGVGGTGQQQQSNPYGFGLGNIATPKAPQPAAPKKVSWKVVTPAPAQGTQGP